MASRLPPVLTGAPGSAPAITATSGVREILGSIEARTVCGDEEEDAEGTRHDCDHRRIARLPENEAYENGVREAMSGLGGEIVPKFQKRKISTWSELRDVLDQLANAGWAFRGQADARWPLESTLTRYLKTFGVPHAEWLKRERKILHAFKRKAHLLLPRTPEIPETAEWLALMQHHGAPTRLLDFSWSPYVAAFFAFERATSDAAVWAIPPNPEIPNYRGFEISVLLNKALQLNDYRSSLAEIPQSIDGKKIPAVVIGEPVLMNQRMTTQVGTFIVPVARIDIPLEVIVAPSYVLRLKLITKDLRKETMIRLHNMNISNASLFPGVDGLARSLAYELEFQWEIDLAAAERLGD